MNYEEVLGLKKGPGGGPSPLIDFYKVKVTGGTLRIALPWNPRPVAPHRRRSATPRWPPSGPSPAGSSRTAPTACGGSSSCPISTPGSRGSASRRPDRQAVHRRHRLARDPGERSGRDRPRRRGTGPAARRQRHLQPLARLAAGHALLRRRRRHLAARHHPVRLPGDLAPRQPGRSPLGLARLSRDDRAAACSPRKSETGARTAYDIRDLHLRERRAADRRRAGRHHRPPARSRLPRHAGHAPRPRPRRGAGVHRLAAVLRDAQRHRGRRRLPRRDGRDASTGPSPTRACPASR